MNIHSIFPTPVAQVNLNRALTDDEYNCIMQQPHRPDMMNEISNDFNILNQPALKQIKAFCEYYSQQYWEKVYAPAEHIKCHVTLSWANYFTKDQWCNEHNHSNSIFSGVFYVQTDPDDAIMFHKTVEYKALTWPNKEDTPWNSDRLMFRATPGDLLLFPSSLTHTVVPVMHDKVRVSIAFNTWLSGEIGEDLSILKL